MASYGLYYPSYYIIDVFCAQKPLDTLQSRLIYIDPFG